MAEFSSTVTAGNSARTIAPARCSPEARAKARRQRTADGWPVQSFQDWLKDLATIVKNRIQPRLRSLPAFEMTTRPTAVQQYVRRFLWSRLPYAVYQTGDYSFSGCG